MQFKALVFAAIAAVAAAAPSEDAEAQWHCEPATYACTWQHGKPGWKVCDTNEKWQVCLGLPFLLISLSIPRPSEGVKDRESVAYRGASADGVV